jgi:hypothetical protein
LDIPVPDPRQVLPIDVVTEMVKAHPLLVLRNAFAEKPQVVGKECQHPLETCFVFNEFAEVLMKVDWRERSQKMKHFKYSGIVKRSVWFIT